MARYVGSSPIPFGEDDGAEGQDQPDRPRRGLTVREVARRYRIGTDRVRSLIRSGELQALNLALVRCGRPRFVIMPEALAKFEQARSATPPPKPTRRKKWTTPVDYFPGD